LEGGPLCDRFRRIFYLGYIRQATVAEISNLDRGVRGKCLILTSDVTSLEEEEGECCELYP